MSKEDFDKFISEEVSKIIFSISESSSTILTPPPISNELKQLPNIKLGNFLYMSV